MRADHDWDAYMHWCRCCGRSMEEIIATDQTHCDGLRGVTHAHYTHAKARHDTIFQPILSKVMELLSRH